MQKGHKCSLSLLSIIIIPAINDWANDSRANDGKQDNIRENISMTTVVYTRFLFHNYNFQQATINFNYRIISNLHKANFEKV